MSRPESGGVSTPATGPLPIDEYLHYEYHLGLSASNTAVRNLVDAVITGNTQVQLPLSLDSMSRIKSEEPPVGIGGSGRAHSRSVIHDNEAHRENLNVHFVTEPFWGDNLDVRQVIYPRHKQAKLRIYAGIVVIKGTSPLFAEDSELKEVAKEGTGVSAALALTKTLTNPFTSFKGVFVFTRALHNGTPYFTTGHFED